MHSYMQFLYASFASFIANPMLDPLSRLSFLARLYPRHFRFFVSHLSAARAFFAPTSPVGGDSLLASALHFALGVVGSFLSFRALARVTFSCSAFLLAIALHVDLGVVGSLSCSASYLQLLCLLV